MNPMVVVMFAAILVLSNLSWASAKEGGHGTSRGPNENAFKHANDNAEFKRGDSSPNKKEKKEKREMKLKKNEKVERNERRKDRKEKPAVVINRWYSIGSMIGTP